MEAGGHVGQVSLIVLLQQLLFEISEVPIFVAGGIGTGKMCAHLFLMGAAGIQLGTRFAVAEESCAHPDFKQKLLQAQARDAVSAPQFDSRLPVVAVRALRNKGHDDFGRLQLELVRQLDEGSILRSEAQEKVEEFWMGALHAPGRGRRGYQLWIAHGRSVGWASRQDYAGSRYLGGTRPKYGG
jgi:enoyl-[acyl-carrier protein] reductase II